MKHSSPPAFLDANVLLRYLTDSPPELADRAARILDGDEPLWVSELTLAEVAYVLSSVYGVERSAIVDSLISLVQQENILPFSASKPFLLEAFDLCRSSNRVSFADALLWAQARTEEARVYTFDRRFPARGVQVVSPP